MTQWPIQLVIGAGFLVDAALPVAVAGVSPGFLATSVVAWLLQWGITWLSYRAFLSRSWWRRHVRTSAGVILLITAFVAVVTALVLSPWPGTDGWTVLWRFGIILLVTALMTSVSDYRAEISHERDVQTSLRRTRAEGIALVGQLRDGVVNQLLGMLTESFDETSPDEAGARRMQRFAREQVRPLSHELAEAMPPLGRAVPQPSQRYSWREALADVTSAPLVRPLPMAIAVTILFIFATVETTTAEAPVADVGGDGLTVSVDVSTLVSGLAALVVVFVATWFAAYVAARVTAPILPRLDLGARVALAVATVVGIGLLVVAVVHAVALLTSSDGDPAAGLFSRLWVSLPIVAVAFAIVVSRSIAGLLRDSGRRVRDLTSELEWENTRIANALHQERQFFATQLHGPIQSAAAAAALRLESTEASPEALEQVRADLMAAIRDVGQGPPDRRDMREELDKLTRIWTGVCEVQVDIPDSVIAALDDDWVASGTVLDLLVDAVANAVMHGSAAHVQIAAVRSAEAEVEVTVINDGSADLGGERGLGSALLDSTCVRWSRGQVDGRVRLDAVVAVPRLALSAR